MGMVFPVSTHNYAIRYWLAASNISRGFYYDPSTAQGDIAGFLNSDVELSVTPPPQMPTKLLRRVLFDCILRRRSMESAGCILRKSAFQ